ncbi:MAG: hypothetical protein M0Z56_05355 [Desulfobacteraceae bacterium]|nr:hypothetical protein [Desulfobacteraceae bacterium]
MYIAIPKGSETPRIGHPPISAHRFSGPSLKEGITDHLLDGVQVKGVSPVVTLADCFKFRNKIGMDVFLEALKLYRTRKTFNPTEVMKYARICRVEKVITPYLESIL